jgi:uncharacterized tellurite resistance protein B-like protein
MTIPLAIRIIPDMSFIDVVYSATGLRIGSDSLGSDADSQILIASLLALVAKSDGGISPDESLRMVELLRGRFQLQPGEALNLLARSSDEMADHTTELDEMFTGLNEKMTLAQKEDLMLMVLSVISADNQKAAGEMKLLATLLEGLDIPDKIMENVYERYFDNK